MSAVQATTPHHDTLTTEQAELAHKCLYYMSLMREVEDRRQLAQSQGELFDAPDVPQQEVMPTILPPEHTVVNEDHTPRSSLIEAQEEVQAPPANPEHQTESNG